MKNDVFDITLLSFAEKKTVTVEWVQGLSSTGEFTILPNHAPFVSRLNVQSDLVFKEHSGTIKTITVDGGVLVVNPDGNVQIILSSDA